MDMQNMDLMGGSLQISTDVIAKIARCAAMEIDGVADVSCGRQQSRKAKELLEVTDHDIIDIAIMVGYSSNSTFTRAFHDVTGMSPNAYRKSCAQKISRITDL